MVYVPSSKGSVEMGFSIETIYRKCLFRLFVEAFTFSIIKALHPFAWTKVLFVKSECKFFASEYIPKVKNKFLLVVKVL